MAKEIKIKIENTNRMQQLIRMMKEKTAMMVVESPDEYLVHAFVWVAVNRTIAVRHVVIRATAVNLHPLSRRRERDFDGISNHSGVYTFYCSLEYKRTNCVNNDSRHLNFRSYLLTNLVQDILVKQERSHTV